MARDFYEVLGVERNADAAAIKSAYRRLAREHHPDANAGNSESEERFKEISVAYEVLSDPQRRQQYDTYGEAGLGMGAPGGAGGFGFGDLFDAFFGGDPFRSGNTARAAHRGADAEIAVTISLAEAAFGHTARVTLRVPRPCEVCAGSGAAEGSKPRQCETCHGAGEVRQVRQTILGQMVTAGICSTCGGFGEVIPQPCTTCRGDGRVVSSDEIDVEVPAGIDNGQRLRLTGLSAAGIRGGPAGDCFVHIRVTPDPRFERDGTELHTVAEIGLAQAVLGTEVTVPTLDGDEVLRIPAGTQPGTVRRLDGLGVPRLQGKRRGHLHVHVIVRVPTDLSEDAELAMRTYASAAGETVSEPKKGVLSRLRTKR